MSRFQLHNSLTELDGCHHRFGTRGACGRAGGTPMPSHPLSVLVVDDDPDGAESLAQLLRLSGYDARFACTCAEAVEVARRFAADAVILDLALPHIDGYETARRLCAVLGKRPLLVAVTGYHQLEGRSRAEGFDHHFLKPAAPHVLTALLRRYGEGLGLVGAA